MRDGLSGDRFSLGRDEAVAFWIFTQLFLA